MNEPSGFKGTPGPWSVGEGNNTLYEIVVTTPRGLTKSIARVGGYGGDAREHNARLMSASKDLLAALQEVLAEYDAKSCAAKAAYAAIDRALGNTIRTD